MKSSDTDATHILTADHRAVEKLFAQFEREDSRADKGKIANQICTELKIHAQLEEEIFYPALEGKIDDDLLKEAYVEHDGAKMLINEIVAADADDEFFDAKVTVLKEEIENLPMNARGVMNLAAIAPGVKSYAPQSGRALPSAGGAPDLRFINLYMDGVEMKSLFNGNLVGIPQTGSPLPQEALAGISWGEGR